MNTHNNARLTQRSEEMVRAAVDFGLSKAEAARRFNTTSRTVASPGRPLQRSGPRRFARPPLKASFIAEPNPPCHS
jgi:hypothetical protein